MTLTVKEMLELLGTAFNKEVDSNNYKLFSVLKNDLDDLETALIDTQGAHYLDTAEGKNLERIAHLFSITRESEETDEHLRARIKLQFMKLAASGTFKQLKSIMAVVLNTSTANVQLYENYGSEMASFKVYLWESLLEEAGLTVDEFKELLDEVKPAGVRGYAYNEGTFECMGIGDTSDPAKAYNDLADSNPNGGTYSGAF